MLHYLARYVFRIAITNARIVGLEDAGVTFKYRDRGTGRRRTCRLSGEEFMRRFLQHVLPRGFHKVRYLACGIPPTATTPPGQGRCCNCTPPPTGALPDTVVPPECTDVPWPSSLSTQAVPPDCRVKP